jgi:hypothetical protein
MDSAQSTVVTTTAAAQPVGDAPRFIDEDVALGCECANPWLQIESWRQEAGKLMQERS